MNFSVTLLDRCFAQQHRLPSLKSAGEKKEQKGGTTNDKVDGANATAVTAAAAAGVAPVATSVVSRRRQTHEGLEKREHGEQVEAKGSVKGGGKEEVKGQTLQQMFSYLSVAVRKAQMFPRGEEYSIRVGGGSSVSTAAAAVNEAAAETLEALSSVAALADSTAVEPRNSTLVAAAKDQALYHSVRANARKSAIGSSFADMGAGGAAASAGAGAMRQTADSGSLVPQRAELSAAATEQRSHRSLLHPLHDFLDDLLDDVETALSHHARQPNTPLPGGRAVVSCENSNSNNNCLVDNTQPGICGQQQRLELGGNGLRQQRQLELASYISNMPQRQWIHLIDNFSCRFVPRLPFKLHAKKPMHPAIRKAQHERMQRELQDNLENAVDSSKVTSRVSLGDTKDADVAATEPGVQKQDREKQTTATEETGNCSFVENDSNEAADASFSAVAADSSSEACSGAVKKKQRKGSTQTGNVQQLSPALEDMQHQSTSNIVPEQKNSSLMKRTSSSTAALAKIAAASGTENSALAISAVEQGSTNEESSGSVGQSPLPHVYEYELNSLKWREDDGSAPTGVFGGPALFAACEPQKAKLLENTPLVRVTTRTQLQKMLDELTSGAHKVVGVDVEHHSMLSYRGFCCLLQLSTREKDYIIDPFPLFADLHHLNQFTADPSILKVLHGADSDILWLQRDFSVYIVNMFDTVVAARLLQTPDGASLENLLRRYVNFHADKKYQKADWRQRPLSVEMEHYARCDTHYLPYLFDVMKNELLALKPDCSVNEILREVKSPGLTTGEKAMLYVLQRSKQKCLKTHVERPFDAAAEAQRILRRSPACLSPLSYAVFLDLLKWRDETARKIDRASFHVASPEMLLLLAQTRPTSTAEMFSRLQRLPPRLQHRAPELLAVIQRSLRNAAVTAAATTTLNGDEVVCSLVNEQQIQQKEKQTAEKEGPVSVSLVDSVFGERATGALVSTKKEQRPELAVSECSGLSLSSSQCKEACSEYSSLRKKSEAAPCCSGSPSQTEAAASLLRMQSEENSKEKQSCEPAVATIVVEEVEELQKKQRLVEGGCGSNFSAEGVVHATHIEGDGAGGPCQADQVGDGGGAFCRKLDDDDGVGLKESAAGNAMASPQRRRLPVVQLTVSSAAEDAAAAAFPGFFVVENQRPPAEQQPPKQGSPSTVNDRMQQVYVELNKLEKVQFLRETPSDFSPREKRTFFDPPSLAFSATAATEALKKEEEEASAVEEKALSPQVSAAVATPSTIYMPINGFLPSLPPPPSLAELSQLHSLQAEDELQQSSAVQLQAEAASSVSVMNADKSLVKEQEKPSLLHLHEGDERCEDEVLIVAQKRRAGKRRSSRNRREQGGAKQPWLF